VIYTIEVEVCIDEVEVVLLRTLKKGNSTEL